MTTNALTLTDTTIGKKIVMALSGLVLFGFVIGHMLGNLQVYLGPEVFNAYATSLHAMPPPVLWGVRGVLIAAIAAHAITAVQLTALNSSARPIGYKKKIDVATSYAARTMKWTGPLVLVFLVYHLAHLTGGFTEGLDYQHSGPENAYLNVVTSFQVPWNAALYIVANIMLGFHLYHGAWSLFQSLGLTHRRYNTTVRSIASGIALAVVLGFLSIPISVFMGWVGQ